MSSIFSEDLRVTSAVNFKELVSRQISNNRIYFTFGKPTAWANDAAPDVANSSVTVFNDVWKNMIGAKLLTGNEVKHVIPRNTWAANTAYDAYDHCECSLNLFDSNTHFYVVTSSWNVYKCLDNNNAANSTVMPTQIFTDKAIEEIDGYVWRYMYTVSSEDQLRYTTPSYIPVQYITEDNGSLQWSVQENAVSGALESVQVTANGSYTNASNITITITGDGTGATAAPRVNVTSNTLTNIIITAKGSGYTYANVAITTTDSGANGAARAIISPPGGHGKNALRELGGSRLILNPKLNQTESGYFPVSNQFRQITLMQNPYERDGTTLAANTLYTQYTTAILDTATSQYNDDEYVYQGSSLSAASFSGIVENWDSGNNTIRLTNISGTLQADVLVGANSGTARFVQSITANKLAPYTGSFLYIDNIVPITRAADQSEDFKITMKF